MVRDWYTKRVLITGKTYPNPARKGVEVSCIGGITEEGEWIRLFPIPFRLLEDAKKFQKYDLIQVNVTKARSDQRPESYQVDPDSITVVHRMPSGGAKWRHVMERLIPLTSSSLCGLQKGRKETGITLGCFRPAGNVTLSIDPAEPEWTPGQLQKLNNFGMFDNVPSKALEKIPHKFTYKFKCSAEACEVNLHNLSCVDWELIQTYRNFRHRYGDKWEIYFLEKAIGKFFQQRDIHFLVGTVHRFPDIWIIGGIFYPPKDLARQLSFPTFASV